MANGEKRGDYGRGVPGVSPAQVQTNLDNHANQCNSNNPAYHESRNDNAPAPNTGTQGTGK